jgi:hypothetical protein
MDVRQVALSVGADVQPPTLKLMRLEGGPVKELLEMEQVLEVQVTTRKGAVMRYSKESDYT